MDPDNEEEVDFEPDCSVCLNILIESCLLPCKHRICYQCIKANESYLKQCPVCELVVPHYFRPYFYHNVEQEIYDIIKKKMALVYEVKL